jgi:mannose-6-phosphate isomerase-like protein (cupin superfamily)
MEPIEMEKSIVRYGELRPCTTAFIDAHTPGSEEKENFSIIGRGVSESPEQYVHIEQTPGFNIGAAGQPPGCTNSLHYHHTAEVFFVLAGRWRFFWGRLGDAGEVILEEGDIFNIPTGVFRGFENVGSDYGMIMSVLGGDDAGGGVIWAPQVIEAARDHGLILGENGMLVDSKKGEQLPPGVGPMPILAEDMLRKCPEPLVSGIVRTYVARYLDLLALAANEPCTVIGESGVLRDRPGFEVELLTGGSIPDTAYSSSRHEVLMIMRGHWRIAWQEGEVILAPGDTCMLPPEFKHVLSPAMTGEASLYRVIGTDDPAGPTVIF